MTPPAFTETRSPGPPTGGAGAAADALDSRGRRIGLMLLFVAALGTHFYLTTMNWHAGFLVGHEFRQTHTAIITYYLDKENRFSLHYTTPLFGKPWSVPLEFPLYEWSVVLLSRAAHLPHFEAARTVSLTCFYLMLPAVWLLLGSAGVAPARRLLVLALPMVCPVYIFYSRAFLMDSMVLMFAVWFLAAFVRVMRERRIRWLVLCAVAGSGAGLIKSPTFFVWLFPAAAYGAWRLWRSARPWTGWGPIWRTMVWGMGAAAVPCGLTFWWVKYTDAIKLPHPSAFIFASSSLAHGSFGLYSLWDRFSPGIWKTLLSDWRLAIMSPWLIGVFLGLGALCFRRQRWYILGAAGLFLFAQVLFPDAYAYQDYYFYACTVFLMVALGFVLVGIVDGRLPAALRWGIILVPFAAMLGSYRWGYLPGVPIPLPPGAKPSVFYGGNGSPPKDYQWGYYWGQVVQSNGGSQLADAIRTVTPENSVIIVAGCDWAPIIPYYAQRKALMIRNGLQYDAKYLGRAFNDLGDEDVSALVMYQDERSDKALIERATTKFGLDSEVTFSWPYADVYMSRIYRDGAVNRLQAGSGFNQITVQAKAQPPIPTSHAPFAVTPGIAADAFKMISPAPTAYRFAYGYNLQGLDGRYVLNVHPDSDLWIPAPAVARSIRWDFGIFPGAYERTGDKTDGVEFSIEGETPDGQRRRIFHRLLNPAVVLKDRGTQQAEIPYQPLPHETLVFSTRPNFTYGFDWAYWAGIEVK